MVAAKVIARQVRSPFNLIVVVMEVALVGIGTANATDLVLHLPLDDGLGSPIAADVSGNGHDATLVNMDPNTDWVSGRSGLALDFEGANGYLSIPDHAALDFGAGDFSVALWVFKRSSTTNYDNRYGVRVFALGRSPGGARAARGG